MYSYHGPSFETFAIVTVRNRRRMCVYLCVLAPLAMIALHFKCPENFLNLVQYPSFTWSTRDSSLASYIPNSEKCGHSASPQRPYTVLLIAKEDEEVQCDARMFGNTAAGRNWPHG